MVASIVRDSGPAPQPPQGGAKPAQLTPQQVQDILSQIATVADSTRALASYLAEEIGGESRRAYCLVYLLDQIGGLADYALGERACVGDFGDWLMGPLFHKEASRA